MERSRAVACSLHRSRRLDRGGVPVKLRLVIGPICARIPQIRSKCSAAIPKSQVVPRWISSMKLTLPCELNGRGYTHLDRPLDELSQRTGEGVLVAAMGYWQPTNRDKR